jgi:hypothetical protein
MERTNECDDAKAADQAPARETRPPACPAHGRDCWGFREEVCYEHLWIELGGEG